MSTPQQAPAMPILPGSAGAGFRRPFFRCGRIGTRSEARSGRRGLGLALVQEGRCGQPLAGQHRRT